MSDLYLLRNKQSGKYYRKLPNLGGIIAKCDADLDVRSFQNLFMFETPEAAFQFLRTQGGPLPKDTEVVPMLLKAGTPISLLEVYPHVSVAIPQDAQIVLANLKATKEELDAAHKTVVVTPDPDHDPKWCTCQGFFQPPDCPIHGRK
jgi:hypothetical protein